MSENRIAATSWLRSLMRPQAFERAFTALSAPASGPHADAKEIRKALAALRELPECLRRLAWVSARATPRRLRMRAHQDRWHLFDAGIVRSLDGLSAASPLSELLAAAATLEKHHVHEFVIGLEQTGAYDVLAPVLSRRDIVSLGASIFCQTRSSQMTGLRSAVRATGVERLHEAVDVAAWLHFLQDPAAEPPDPLAGEIATITLTLPILRGVRRGGFRRHGRRIGRSTIEDRAGAREVMQRTRIPAALMLTTVDPRLIAPLAIDLLHCVIAERPSSGDRLTDCHDLAQKCPLLAKDAATLARGDASGCPVDLGDWIADSCGVLPGAGEPRVAGAEDWEQFKLEGREFK